MAKAAIITDTHFGVRNDSKQFIEYFEKFYSNIFFPYLKENNIDVVFHLGDIVERRKFINYATLHEFKRIFIQPCIDNNIRLLGIVGNHDIHYRNTNEVNAMNELFNHSSIKFYSEPEEINFDGCKIALLPWINNSNYEKSMEFVRTTDASIVFGHLEFSGFEMYRGISNLHGMETKPFDRFEFVFSGHYHTRSSKKNIHYLGNPYETTWNDYNDSRGFHIFDSDTRSLNFIQNPYKMFHKIWYDDSDKDTYKKIIESYNFSTYEGAYIKVIVQKKTNPYWFDMMLDALYKSNPANVSIVEDNKNADMLTEEEIINEADDTLTLITKYVDSISVDVDKNNLKKLLADLYVEAQNMNQETL